MVVVEYGLLILGYLVVLYLMIDNAYSRGLGMIEN